MAPPRDILDRTVAGRTVRESFASAEASGKLIPAGDIEWAIAEAPRVASNWIFERKALLPNCRYYRQILFEHVYQRQSVPAGCSLCYKVKVVPRTLRDLMAVVDIGRALPYTWKGGLDAAVPLTSGIYGAYFYLEGLESARAAYREIREAVDAHPKLGSGISVFIKRGCTEYEIHCGPSDRYTFSDESKEIEAAILPLIQTRPETPQKPMRVKETFAFWIRMAYSLGDDTYLDFTGGRRLYPAVVKYSPEQP